MILSLFHDIARLLSGRRLRVTPMDCSEERLRLMLVHVENEQARITQLHDKKQDEVRRLYRLTEQVDLQYRHGEYAFTLDDCADDLVGLRDRLESLEEKQRAIFQALQEKVLLNRQAAKLGSQKRVRLKDGIILALILAVLGILFYEWTHFQIDFGNLDPNHPHPPLSFWIFDTICCAIFLANFFFELRMAECKRWYWRTRWIDIITSLPLPPAQLLLHFGLGGTEFIRAGRFARLIRALRVLRAFRLFFFFWRGMDHLAEMLNIRLMKKSLLAGFALILVGALAITSAGEQGPGAENVQGFLPSLWWSFTTLVTGGFGDLYNPQTPFGRVLTVLLILAGMTIVGVFTATLTTILVGREERAQESRQNELLDHIKDDTDRTESLLRDLTEQQKEMARRIELLESRWNRSK
ncbi:potassium channel family protein [Roseibacillus persicicus]|uniref:potassium channel family protein n=1 Tax=Roseibacillus persicicus TaxID=454148 RepID=UPI00398BB834